MLLMVTSRYQRHLFIRFLLVPSWKWFDSLIRHFLLLLSRLELSLDGCGMKQLTESLIINQGSSIRVNENGIWSIGRVTCSADIEGSQSQVSLFVYVYVIQRGYMIACGWWVDMISC
jgi:hypothetical protein